MSLKRQREDSYASDLEPLYKRHSAIVTAERPKLRPLYLDDEPGFRVCSSALPIFADPDAVKRFTIYTLATAKRWFERYDEATVVLGLTNAATHVPVAIRPSDKTPFGVEFAAIPTMEMGPVIPFFGVWIQCINAVHRPGVVITPATNPYHPLWRFRLLSDAHQSVIEEQFISVRDVTLSLPNDDGKMKTIIPYNATGRVFVSPVPGTEHFVLLLRVGLEEAGALCTRQVRAAVRKTWTTTAQTSWSSLARSGDGVTTTSTMRLFG